MPVGWRCCIAWRTVLRTLMLMVTLSLAACGGGSSSGDSSQLATPAPVTTVTPTPPASTVTTPSAPSALSAADVTVAGSLRYESVPSNSTSGALVYSATAAKPIRGAVVEVYSSPADQLVGTGLSDEAGAYSIKVSDPGAAVFVRVKAQLLQSTAPGWDIRVADNTQGSAQYVLDTPAKSVSGSSVTIDATAATGWTGSSYGASRSSAPFAILDSIYLALQKVRSADPTRAWPRLNLYWSVNNRPAAGDFAQGSISSTLYAGPDEGGVHQIYVLGRADVDTDEFDKHVITHEFGHYLQRVASRNDSLGGSHGSEALDMRVAFSEGWGDGWSTIATEDPVYVDTSGPGQASASRFDFSRAPTSGQGWYKSDTVAYLLWKFNEQIGFPAIWQALVGATTNNSAVLSNLHLFAVALKVAAPSKAATIDSLLANQRTTAADVYGSTETNSGGIADVLPLYKIYGALSSNQTLCANVAVGTPDTLNKLGNWAFTRFTAPTTRPYSFALTGGSDPDFTLYGVNGFRRLANTSAAGSETLTVNLNAGEYVIAATEFSLTGRTCLNLVIN